VLVGELLALLIVSRVVAVEALRVGVGMLVGEKLLGEIGEGVLRSDGGEVSIRISL